MLRFLLDEHLSPNIAEGLRRRDKTIIISCLSEWEKGRFLGIADDVLLQEAAEQSLTLVTYDQKTIPLLLKMRAEASRDHGGVIFVDNKTISSSDLGRLIYALAKLFKETAHWDWTNRIYFLQR
jgi:hypothetical protein